MSFENFGRFVSAEVAHKELPKKSEKAEELLRGAKEQFSHSTILHTLEDCSEEDLFLLDSALNIVGADFTALAGFEEYESSEEVSELNASLENLKGASTVEEKKKIARLIAEKVR